MPEHVSSTPDGTNLRFAVIATTWYPELVERLEAAALDTLRAAGVDDDRILVVKVPGAYELPQAAGWVARADDVDAIVALGCVIQGETPHFDFVSAACCEGLMQVALETGVPVGLGVITANTRDQAEARASADAAGKGGNKGIEAADAALRMARTYQQLEARRKDS